MNEGKSLSKLKKNKIMNAGKIILSVIMLIALWWLASSVLGDSVLPSPIFTLQTMIEDLLGGKILPAVGVTLLRVLETFVLTLVIGTIVGCLLGLSKTFKTLFGYWVVIGTSIPPLVIIIVIFLGMGLNETAAVTAAVLTTVFTIIQNIEQGVKSIDKKLIEMGMTFHAPKTLMVRRIILPQIYPYIMASARFGLSLTWKMVIFVEQMGRSDGIGYNINHWYQMYNMEHVLSYAVFFIIIMLLFEFIIDKFIEPHLFKWKVKKS